MGKKKLFRRTRKSKGFPCFRVDKPGYLCGFRLRVSLFEKEEDWVVDSKFFSQAQGKEEENV